MLSWNLADLLERVVDEVPGREAVVTTAAVRLTYAQFDERANQLAHVLASAGVGVDDRVALVVRNGHEYLEGMFAAFKLRAIPVNVNTRYTTDELEYLLADSDPQVVITEPDRRDRVRPRGEPRRQPHRDRAAATTTRSDSPPSHPPGR